MRKYNMSKLSKLKTLNKSKHDDTLFLHVRRRKA
jgi:hypothetical protein